MWEYRRYRTIYRRHPRPRLVKHLHFRRDLRNETGAATVDFWRELTARSAAPPRAWGREYVERVGAALRDALRPHPHLP